MVVEAVVAVVAVVVVAVAVAVRAFSTHNTRAMHAYVRWCVLLAVDVEHYLELADLVAMDEELQQAHLLQLGLRKK